MKKNKVFLGFIDIAGQISEYANSYSNLGYKVTTVVRTRISYFPYSRYNIILEGLIPPFLKKGTLLRKLYLGIVYIPLYHMLMLYFVFSNDIFHFIWYNAKTNFFYFWLIKRLNKKIIIQFVGSDVKWIPLHFQEFEFRRLDTGDQKLRMVNTQKQKITLNSRLRYVRISEKFADLIISIPEQAQLQLRPYYNFYLPVTKNIKQKKRSNRKLKVALGITESKAKGTDKVIEILKNYINQSTVDFELIKLAKIPHDKVLNILEITDIFIYTPYSCGAGKFGHEAVAAGAVTLVGYDKDWLALPENPPFVHIQENTLIEKLDYFLRNHEERIKLSEYGIVWAKNWTDPDWIISDILDKLNNDRPPDYIPKFFRDQATFDSIWDKPDSYKVANKWTKYVSREKWYKENISPGYRDKLIFEG
ncbi:MAG: hypothetical protein M0Q41_07510 [Bacteroidales bacterium]|nr:hypothetical protein [Acholeplasmataceae bacterium]MCK9448812.1 hypothetical protein [Bacteroidales bacterium]